MVGMSLPGCGESGALIKVASRDHGITSSRSRQSLSPYTRQSELGTLPGRDPGGEAAIHCVHHECPDVAGLVEAQDMVVAREWHVQGARWSVRQRMPMAAVQELAADDRALRLRPVIFACPPGSDGVKQPAALPRSSRPALSHRRRGSERSASPAGLSWPVPPARCNGSPKRTRTACR